MEVYDSKYVLLEKGIVFRFVTIDESLIVSITKKEEEIQASLSKKECMYLSKIFLESALSIEQEKDQKFHG